MDKKSKSLNSTIHFNKKKTDIKSLAFYIGLVSLPLLQFLVMYVYVNFNSLIMAFRSYDFDKQIWSWVGFQNFKDLFYDIRVLPSIRAAFANSFKIWIISTIVGVPLGLMFAFYIFKKYACSGFFRIMLFIPSILSANLLMIIFKYYSDNALPMAINAIFGTHLKGLLTTSSTQFITLLIYNIFIGFGVSVLMYIGAMGAISESCLEAAELDGVNVIQEFFKIVLPQILGTVSVFIVTGIAGMFINQLNLWSIYHVNADPSTYTIGYFIYRGIFLAGESYNQYPYYAALGVVITVIVAPVIYFARKLINKLNPMEN